MIAIKMTGEKKKRAIELHATGLSNVAIAAEVGVSSTLVNRLAKQQGLLPHGRRGPEMVDAANAKCKTCREVRPVQDFLVVEKNAKRKSTFTMSQCRACWNSRIYASRNKTVESQIRYKMLTLKNRIRRDGTPSRLSVEHMIDLWNAQNGRCFYTDVVLDITAGTGRKPNSMSVDRVIPEVGYVPGNVVLCADRINAMKHDATLEEMKLWMPPWHERVMTFLTTQKDHTPMKHIAHTMTFDDLWQGLQEAKAAGLVREQSQGDLHLFVYSETTVYERQWTPWTIAARGLILNPSEKKIVATPFEKFFNYGERADQMVPDCAFDTLEKLDGSLIILFHHKGEWRTATKGSLGSEQAKWAARWIAEHDLSCLDTGTTYLAEALYPENRIVVHYQHTGLVLLGAYRGDGSEVNYEDLLGLGEQLGWRIAKRHFFSAVSELLALAKTLPPSEEGFVLRFSNGLRLKVKGDEYCRIHRMVSRLTPLAMWEAMQAGDDLEAIRKQLPEEFWADFDNIIAILQRHIAELVAAVKAVADPLAELSDKDVGLRLDTFPAKVRRFIFPYRKSGGDLLSGRTRDLVFREIRPDGNRLDGYAPSTAMNRVMDEAA